MAAIPPAHGSRLTVFSIAATIIAATCLSAQSPLEPGGSNYIAYYVNPQYLQGCRCAPPYDNRNPAWVAWARSIFLKGGFGHTIADYHKNPELIRQQLRQMYDGGQRKISLLLHLLARTSECLDLAAPAPDVCHTTHAYSGEGSWGYAVPLDSTTSQLPIQTSRNLRNLLEDIRRTGFTQVNLRFGAFGNLDPRGWRNGADTTWNAYHQFLYDIYWTAVRSTIDSVNRWLPASDSVRVFYDLDFEIANYLRQLDGKPWNSPYSFGHTAEHSRHLWRDYLARYGNVRTVGFTFGNRILYPSATGWERDVIAVVNHDVYDPEGQRPFGYAFDVYGNSAGRGSGLSGCTYPCYDRFFEEAARQLKQHTAGAKLLIWESLYNDYRFAQAVRAANRMWKLGIPYIMQWPTKDQSWGSNFTEPFPKAFNQYLRLSQ